MIHVSARTSSFRSSDKYFTEPLSAAFSQPTICAAQRPRELEENADANKVIGRTLLGNAQVPSVTVRLRAKLAPEVARRLESFSACAVGESATSWWASIAQAQSKRKLGPS